MANMKVDNELEMLRKEVEQLRKEKEERVKLEKEQEAEEQKARELEQKEAEEKAREIMQSIEEGKTDAKEIFNELLQTIKKDYENLSPTSAIVLFALGAAFGHALSSK